MTGNNRQFQPKRINETNKNDLSPLILSPSRSRRNDQWIEEELLAEDDPLASNPPRPPTSSIRWNTPTTGRRGTGTRDVSIETTRQQIPVPPRRTAQIYNPSTGPVQARSRRNTTFQPASSPLPAQRGEQKKVHWMLYVGVGMIAALALWVTITIVQRIPAILSPSICMARSLSLNYLRVTLQSPSIISDQT